MIWILPSMSSVGSSPVHVGSTSVRTPIEMGSRRLSGVESRMRSGLLAASTSKLTSILSPGS